MDILTVEPLDGIVKALEGGSKNHRFDRTGHVAPQPFRQLDPEGIYAGGNDRLPRPLSPARHWFWSIVSGTTPPSS